MLYKLLTATMLMSPLLSKECGETPGLLQGKDGCLCKAALAVINKKKPDQCTCEDTKVAQIVLKLSADFE